MDLTAFMLDIFGPYGEPGVVLMVFLAFLLDATLIPFLPEIFIILGFSYNPEPYFAVVLVTVSILAEVLGNCVLYLIVKRIHVPKRIRSIANKYIGILLVNDERILLINRIAPMVPYSGAFIAMMDNWKLSRALFYVALGCVLKYGLILSMSSVFYAYFSSNMASIMMIVFVIIILAISLALSYLRKKRAFGDE
ncbi:MAG: hypothetical protein IKC93_06090 [Candidatus Methanomethylophilaceae archaeon]|nr:hypothetical protein [Candidatus Methanomethylophilaceae archaeon]